MRRSMFVWMFAAFALLSTCRAQWLQSNGPFGGPVYAIGVNPGAAGGTAIFAGSLGGGVFRSTNNGVSWVSASNGLSFGGTYFGPNCFAFIGTNAFAGTSAGVYVSTNNGTTWTVANTGLTNTGILALMANGATLFAGTSGGGVFRSTNNGGSWTASNTGITNNRVNALHASGANLFAGTDAGVFISTNGGTNWTASNSGLTNTTVRALASAGSTLFVGTFGGVFRSTNNGTSWTNVTPILSSALAVSGQNIYSGGTGVILSTDNGATWNPAAPGMDNLLVTSLALNGASVFAGTAAFFSGVYVSTGGSAWIETNQGVAATSVKALASGDNGSGGLNVVAGTNENGVYVSTNNGTTWTSSKTGLSNASIDAIAIRGSTFLAGGFLGVQKSTNSGVLWSSSSSGLPPTVTVKSFAFAGANILAGTSAGVFISTNDGTNWTARNSGISNLGINVVAISGLSCYAAGNGMYISTNEGVNWTLMNSGLTSTNISSIAFLGTDIFAGSQNGVFRSTNGGTSWSAVNTGLTVTSVSSLLTVGSNLIAGTTFGLYLSSNRGTTWAPINTGFPENLGIIYPSIQSLAAVPNGVGGVNILAATFLMGIWRRPISEFTHVNLASATIPDEFGLSQNYPNPFNPTTTISFAIPRKSTARLTVFDLTGRTLATLFDQELEAGTYNSTFDAASIASGTYFYRLETPEFVQTKKFIVQK